MKPEVEKKLDEFFKQFKLVKYKKKELIYQPGSKVDTVSFVKTGYVRLYSVSKEGEERTINIFKPVFYLSLIYAISENENPYYMEAITPVEIYRAPKETVLNFIRSQPDMLFDLMVSILDGFREMLLNSQSGSHGTAYSKVASIILSLANNYGSKKGKSTVINFATTHRVLASLTGTARETTSLQVLKLKDKGIIRTRGSQIIIDDMDGLKRETEI
jgi:CRP-like cAMP-binding protein